MNRVRVLLTCALTALLATPLLATWEDGVAAFKAGRYEDATAVFRSVVTASPDAPSRAIVPGNAPGGSAR